MPRPGGTPGKPTAMAPGKGGPSAWWLWLCCQLMGLGHGYSSCMLGVLGFGEGEAHAWVLAFHWPRARHSLLALDPRLAPASHPTVHGMGKTRQLAALRSGLCLSSPAAVSSLWGRGNCPLCPGCHRPPRSGISTWGVIPVHEPKITTLSKSASFLSHTKNEPSDLIIWNQVPLADD